VSTIGTSTATVEAGTLTQSDPGLGVTKTSPIKYANMTLLSNELLVDSAVDIAQLVMNHMGESMAKGYGPAFCTGAGGAGTITGYMTGGSVTATGAGTITPANVIKLQSTVNQRYRAANAMFATNDPVLAYLRAYRATGGTDGPWLVQQPSAPGFPETIFGAPVVIDSNVAASGSGVKEMAFGSFERGYIVHEAGLRFESSYDYAFNTDQTAYRQILRLDGEVQDSAAYGIYQRSS
jgi:HK97 family phage major capsid protein